MKSFLASEYPMLPEIDIWRSAAAMMKRYGEAAGHEAAKLADKLLAEGDLTGSANWRQIMTADGD